MLHRKSQLCRRVGVFVLTAGQALLGQTAQITGRLMDTTEGAIPGAEVVVLNTGTGVRRTVSTNEAGYYTAPLLSRGEYRVTARKDGFRPITRTGVALDEGQVLRLDFVLEVGQVTETIEVSGTPTLLDTSTTALSTVIPNQRVLDLPLLGRNPISLAVLVPGVRPVNAFGGLQLGAFVGSRMSIAGGAPSANNMMVDGVAAENFTSGGLNGTLSVEATEEFRIITRNPSAEFGRTGGGVINMISKSGTNELRLTLFHFLRNKVLDANAFFANRSGRERAPLVFNQFGATAGGPVKKNQTFFFFNWEAVRQRGEATALMTVPTALQKRGDFSQTLTQAGALIRVFDPATTAIDPADPTRRIRSAFPNNAVPASRIHPVATAAVSYYPAPNLPGVPNSGANNFYGQAASIVDKNIYGIKVDHNFTPGRRLYGRFTYDYSLQGAPNYYGNIAEPLTSPLVFQRRSVVLNHLETLSPVLLLELKAGLNRYAPRRPARSYGFDVTTLGLPASLNSQIQWPVFPRFNVTDMNPLGAVGGDHLIQANNAWTWGGSLTKIRAAHNLKLGAEYRVYQLNNTQNNNVLDFTFARTFTQGPNPNVASAAAGFGLATMLLGTPTSGIARRWSPTTYQATNFSAYIQDDWKVTPRLTLNLGLRWEFEGAVTDRFNGISNFDPNLEFPLGTLRLRGGLVFPGVGGLSRGMRDNSFRDFGPRFGAAYQLLPRTSIRAAYGIYHLPGTGNFVGAARTGFDLATNMVTSIDGGFTPYDTLTNPFPQGIQPIPGSSLGPLTGLGTAVNGNLRSMVRGYSQQWTFNIQQELAGGWLAEAGYMGNRGVSLPANRVHAYLPEQALALGTGLQQLAGNPFFELITTGPLSQRNVTRASMLRRFPHFTGASGLDSWASSIYHALGVRVEKRFSKGFSVLASYTFSKMIDDNLGNGLNTAFAAGGSNDVQNWDNLRAERAVSTSNLPHNLVVTSSWELPAAGWSNPILRGLLDGWQVNPILTLQSGNPIAVTAQAPAFGGNRPNVSGDPNLPNPTIERWFNTAAFTPIQPFTFGNAPRNLPRTRTDSLFSLDLSLQKNFRVGERFTLQFRGEFFNATNTPTFDAPGSTLGTGAFGVVSSSSDPRRVQFGLKLYY